MRIALVHDYLNQVGGGERVLDELIRLFPEADVYTLMYDEVKTFGRYKGKVRGTSFLDFQFARDHHRLFIPLMPFAAKSITIPPDVDLVISDTAGFAKGISYDKTRTKHISYIHTPLRYAWETKTYFGHNWRVKSFNFIFAPAFWYVRRFDYKAAQQPDVLLANSKYIADKIKKYYGRDSSVVYPPVDTKKFFPPSTLHPTPSSYYLAAGRLLHYKRFDLIIDAFSELKLPLKIVGAGPEFDALKARNTSPKIDMLGFVKDDAKLRELYQNAKGFIMANEEDFGLVTAEAQACGAPVIAYRAGGSEEIVEEGRTGVFFNQQTPDSLVEAVKRFEKMKFNPAMISHSMAKFSLENFKEGIEATVEKVGAVKM